MKHPRRMAWIASTFASFLLAGAGQARADLQLITNGGFETGTFAGWTVANQLSSTDYAGGSNARGSFYVQGTSGTLPVSGGLTGGAALQPHAGSNYALSDSTAPGVHALLQSFTVPAGAGAVALSFAMYNYDYSGEGPTGGTSLDYLSRSNQHVQVDILTAAAGAFATDSGSVVRNLYDGEISNPAGTNPPAWQTFSYDLTGLSGAYQLRFAEVDNNFTLNMGIDDVSILAAVPAVPEPSSLFLVASGVVAVALHRRRRRDRD